MIPIKGQTYLESPYTDKGGVIWVHMSVVILNVRRCLLEKPIIRSSVMQIVKTHIINWLILVVRKYLKKNSIKRRYT